MAHTEPRIDECISKSADFAKPVLNHLRSIIHSACPEVKETIKWGFPNFEYAGSILCSMASFKQHCAFTFWLGSLMSDPYKILAVVGEKTSMGQLGQIKTIADLPADEILTQYIREAMTLIEKKIKKPVKEKISSKEPEMPGSLLSALQQNENALKNFEKLSPSHKKEYVEWMTEAKTEATRNKRISTTIEWLQEGKSRNWKYMKK